METTSILGSYCTIVQTPYRVFDSGLYRGLLEGILMGILGVLTTALLEVLPWNEEPQRWCSETFTILPIRNPATVVAVIPLHVSGFICGGHGFQVGTTLNPINPINPINPKP